MNLQKKTFTVLLIVSMVSACGGGGGGGGGGGSTSSPPPSGPTLMIDSTNATQVAGLARSAFNLGELPTALVVVAVTAAGKTGSTQSCDTPTGGTPGIVTIVRTQANPNQVLIGDSFDFTFHNCFDNQSKQTFQGEVKLTVRAMTGTPFVPPPLTPPWSLQLDMAFINLSGTSGSTTETLVGAFTFNISEPDSTHSTESINGNTFAVTVSGVTRTLQSFSISTSVVNGTPSTFSENGNGTISRTDIGNNGTANFGTSTPFSGTVGQNPSAGVMTVTGANSTFVTLTAIDNTNVNLNVNGVTTMVPWSSIQ